MDSTDVIVLTPPCLPDAALAIAACRSGARGTLDLEFTTDVDAARKQVERLSRFAGPRFGVKLGANVDRLLDLLLTNSHKPAWLILTAGDADFVWKFRETGIEVLIEAVSLAEAIRAVDLGADGLILKGSASGGRVGADTSSELIQKWRQYADRTGAKVPFWGRDGIGPDTAAACVAGGARGVVLDSQVLLARESPLSEIARKRIAGLDGSETVVLGSRLGESYRIYGRPDSAAAQELAKEEERLLASDLAADARLAAWRKAVHNRLASDPVDGAWPIGQDVATAAGLAAKGVTVAGIIQHIVERAGVDSTSASHSELPPPPPCDVAIIGLSCFYPKAGSLWQYWENILAKANAVVEIPPTHWDWRPYYDPDPRARDKMVSKWGGFMGDTYFDPLVFGITPKSLPNIEPLQLLLLQAVRHALVDAGYLDEEAGSSPNTGSWRLAQVAERTCAILGVGGGGMPLSVSYGFRACMPLMESIPGMPIKSDEIIKLGEGILPEWTEDSFPGILLNVAAGRVANRFNLGGPNMAIDAACGSSLAALYAGVRELNDGTSDVAVVMGGDAVQTPYAYVAFSKTHALSPRGRCRPFDAGADGIALAEGVGVAVLKRLADAERDGDRIYAVIKGVGASSDGRDKGLTAPRAEGQLRALNRAYAQARLSPARVGLVEAHGTGTVVGDQTEARAIGQLMRDAGGDPQSCALGSVKSMIGHSKCAAGLAGLIKTAFALHHKVLPPTLVETPNPKANLDGGPLYLNTEARPWVHGAEHPRTAGVSAFGFGGTNFHTVLEEYTGDFLDRPGSGLRTWPAEIFVWRRADQDDIVADVKKCRDALAAGAQPALADLATSVWQSSKSSCGPTLAVVALSLDDLREKLAAALGLLANRDREGAGVVSDPRGIYFGSGLDSALRTPHSAFPRVAFLFPGQGSQYPDMLAQAAMAFPEVRAALDLAERTLADDLDKPLGKFIYPPSPFTPEQEAANRKDLQRTEVAQPALGAASLGMFRLLTSLGIEPAFLAGHSYGEYAALAAAGAIAEDDLFRLSYRRGKVIAEAAATASGGMIAVDATPSDIEPILKGVAECWLANHNSPHQTVLAGTEAGLKAASEKLQAGSIRAQRIPVACGFHSPLVAEAKEPLAAALAAATFSAPRKPVYSNTTAAPHLADGAAIAKQLAEHLVSPVRFADEIVALHEAGARVFVEVGPQGVLTGLTGQVLIGKPHLALASDIKGRPGLVQLAHMLGQLLAAGVSVHLDRLFQGRGLSPFDLANLGPDTGKPKHSATTWVVNGVRCRPINGPEPRLLGQARAKPEDSEQRTEDRQKTAVSKPRPEHLMPAIAVPPDAPVSPRTAMNPTTTAPALPVPSANGHAPPHASPGGAAEVMMRFQDVMARFLDTQRSVMLGFLGAGGQLPTPSANGHVNFPSANGFAAAMPVAPPAVVNRFASEPAAESRPVVSAPVPSTNGQHLPPPVEANGKHEKTDPPAPTGAALDRDTLLARLLDLVSERTGYPKEALSIDLDLEADLGVDSIKRVEILSALAESIEASADGRQPNLEMEKLSVLKTLRGIADYVVEAIENTVPAPSANGKHESPAAELHPGAREGDVQRLVVRLIDAPLLLRPVFAPPTGTIVVTDDRQGTARELADRLAELDIKVALVSHGASESGLAADLTDPTAVADLIARIHAKHGPVSGLIHLLPLAEPAPDETPKARTRREVKSLYLLARGLEADIREAGKTGSAVLLAVTAMGGTMGFGGDLPDDFFAGHGGVAGFTKCLAFEWPEVAVRVVDVDGATPAPRLVEQLLAELGDPKGPVEVGRAGDHRVTWQVEPGPLETDTPAIELGPDSTMLITGGARGITAKIALELAERYRPRLVLVGASPLPTEESAETVGLTAAADVKAVLMSREPGAKPAAIEAAYRRLLKDREIRGNLTDIRASAATVEYRAVDVCDAAAFGSLIDELNAAGGIAGVIHGAGVIEDKLLRDKTPESFERVFGTKVDSALTLARKLDPTRLKFFSLFASITSRYGNRGQSDYAAANEVLSKLACDLDRKWPGRVASIAWGPWAEVGMVAELEKHLVARGLKLISPAVGAKFAVDEIVYGTKGEPEVLVAGGSEQAARPVRLASAAVAVGAE